MLKEGIITMIDGFHEIVISSENIPAMVMIHHPDERPCQSHWHEGVELVASLNSELNVLCDKKNIRCRKTALLCLTAHRFIR